MKLILGSVLELFEVLPQADLPAPSTARQAGKVAYFQTVSQTRYDGGIPRTRCTITVTSVIPVLQQTAIAEVTIPCGSYAGEPRDRVDRKQYERVQQYMKERQREIEELAETHQVQLRRGVLTLDPKEHIDGVVTPPTPKGDA